jgi:hypothetical protein
MYDNEYHIKKYEIIEWNKCHADPKYFINNYVYHLSAAKHNISALYPWQQNAIDLYDNHSLVVGNVSRQCGATSSALAYILWYCTFNSDKQVILTGPKFDRSRSLRETLIHTYNLLPDFLKIPIIRNTASNITFSNNVYVENMSVSSQLIRSRSSSLVYINDAAFCTDSDLQHFISNVYPTIAGNGKMIITSCPNTENSEFHKIWKYATDHGIGNMGSNGFLSYQVKWNDVPGRDHEFKSKMIQNFKPSTWLREFECQFI